MPAFSFATKKYDSPELNSEKNSGWDLQSGVCQIVHQVYSMYVGFSNSRRKSKQTNKSKTRMPNKEEGVIDEFCVEDETTYQLLPALGPI